MRITNINPSINLVGKPVKIVIFYSDDFKVWTNQQYDNNGYLVDNAHHNYLKSDAIISAKQTMDEIKSIVLIEVFTKDNSQRNVIRKDLI